MEAWRHANPEPDPALSPVERARVIEMEAEIRISLLLAIPLYVVFLLAACTPNRP
jgi:hypothetical protein